MSGLDGEHTRIEYGVLVDRTSEGRGYYWAHISESLPTAQMQAAVQPPDYPVQIKKRLVTRTRWQEMP